MNDNFEDDNEFLEEEPEGESEIEIIELLRKIQQQLSFLEKKVDSLVAQSQNRPPRDRNFRPGGRPPFRKNGDRDHRPGDRRPDRDQGHRDDRRRDDRFENPNARRNRGFQGKKDFYGKRDR